MILLSLPLLHFALAAVSAAWQRGIRWLLLVSLIIDGALVAILFGRFFSGETVQVALGGWEGFISIELAADRLSLDCSVLLLLLSFAITAYLWRKRLKPYFFMLLHLALGSVLSLLFTRDLFNMYVTLELLTLVSFLLVGYEKKARQIWAALKYLVLASMGMGIYLLGVAVVYYHAGTLNLERLSAGQLGGTGSGWVVLASSLLACGVAVKAGVFVFSLWLPSAHSEADPAVSALLSGLVIKMGAVVFFRLGDVFPLSLPLLVLGAVSGILGALYAAFSTDLKRMLAFSTLSQVGLIVIGIGAGTAAGMAGGIEYIVAHGLFKGLLFLAAGTAARAVGSSDVARLVASRRRIPVFARIALLVGTLGIVGMPPLAGFCGKGLLSVGSESIAVHVLLIAISVGTVVAFGKLVPLFVPGGRTGSSWPETVSFGILSMAVILFLPLSVILVPSELRVLGYSTGRIVESLLLVGGGLVLYRFVRVLKVHLPQRIFQLEEAVLIILGGFFFIYLLLLAG